MSLKTNLAAEARETKAAEPKRKQPSSNGKPRSEESPNSEGDGSPSTRTLEGVDISELGQYAMADVDWIVDNVFSADQPTLFGAKSKCLKTTLLIDLAVALPSGTDWLGEFHIARPRKVLFYTGEANYRAASRRIKKALNHRGLGFADLKGMLRIEALDFPKLPRLEDCDKVQKAITKYGSEVVIVDPLFRGLTADMDTNRMATVADTIVNFAQWCQPASLFISHHTTKASARELGAPPDLEDLTGAGIAESFGNWWLMGRNEKYLWDWKHDLCVQYGGRDEQAGGRRIVFNEKDWTAGIESLQDFIGEKQEAARRAADDAKRDLYFQKMEAARNQITRVLKNVHNPMSKTAIEQLRGAIPQSTFRQCFAEMMMDMSICQHPYRDSQDRLMANGYLLAEYGEKWAQKFTESEDAR